MPYDPFGDFVPDTPSRRRGGLLKGLAGHVSPEVTAHLQDIGRTARDLGSSAFDRATDWAADNPDKMESIGERVGQAAGVAAVSPFIGGKAGKKAGKKVGGILSRKAKERRGESSESTTESTPSEPIWDPFS